MRSVPLSWPIYTYWYCVEGSHFQVRERRATRIHGIKSAVRYYWWLSRKGRLPFWLNNRMCEVIAEAVKSKRLRWKSAKYNDNLVVLFVRKNWNRKWINCSIRQRFRLPIIFVYLLKTLMTWHAFVYCSEIWVSNDSRAVETGSWDGGVNGQRRSGAIPFLARAHSVTFTIRQSRSAPNVTVVSRANTSLYVPGHEGLPGSLWGHDEMGERSSASHWSYANSQ